ncbi:MAG: SlyX family protein [Desulfomonilia bacterium]
MSEERFATLETMVAYHEDTIQKLNDVVYKQQLIIDRLEERVEAITRLLQNTGQSYTPGESQE